MTKICTGVVLLVLLSLNLNSCGSGAINNPSGAPLTNSATLIKGKAFGYYGDCSPSCFADYSNHVSLYHSAPWATDFNDIAQGIINAEKSGKSIILSLQTGTAFASDCHIRISNFLSYLASQQVINDKIFAIYVEDEPNLPSKHYTEEQVKNAVACTREEVDKFEAIRGKPLYAIYGCKDKPWIGITYFDITACDEYDIGDKMLTEYLPDLKKLGKPIFLVPGGACPWNYNPYAMVNTANSDEQIIGIHAFIWMGQYGGTQYCGISGSSALLLYQSVLGLQH